MKIGEHNLFWVVIEHDLFFLFIALSMYPDVDKDFGVSFAKERESSLCDRVNKRNSPAGQYNKKRLKMVSMIYDERIARD